MHFKVEKAPLVNVLQNLIAIVPTKTTLQVLTNFLVSLKGNELTLSATDLDISMKTTLQVNGSQDGDVTVNARKLFEIARELPEGSVTVEVANNVLQITAEKGFTCKIAGSDTGDFPASPAIDSALEFTSAAHIVQNLSGRTGFAVSTDGTRLSLNGIFWDIRDKQMCMVATDGHRLGYCSYKHSFDAKGGKGVILSPKATNQLGRLITENTEKEVEICIGSNYASFKAGPSTIATKLIEGPYPNYDQVVPKGNNKRASIDKSELMAAIRRVSILSSVKTHQVKFSFKRDQLELSAVNRDFGAEAKEEIPASYTADPIEIGFNATFFLEILKLVDAPRVRMSLNTPLSACLFHPETEDKPEAEYFFLLMPLRLLNEK